MKLSPVSLVAAALAAGNAIAAGPPPPHGGPHYWQGSPHAPQGGPPPPYGDPYYWQGSPHAHDGLPLRAHWQGGPAQAADLQGNPLHAQGPPYSHGRPPNPPWLDGPRLPHAPPWQSGLPHDPHAQSGPPPHAPGVPFHPRGFHPKSGSFHEHAAERCATVAEAHKQAKEAWEIATLKARKVYVETGEVEFKEKHQVALVKKHQHSEGAKVYKGYERDYREQKVETLLQANRDRHWKRTKNSVLRSEGEARESIAESDDRLRALGIPRKLLLWLRQIRLR